MTSLLIGIANLPAAVVADPVPLEISPGSLTIRLNGEKSTNSSGALTAWAWDFGDGQTGSGETVDHSYAQPGVYRASLNVTGGGQTNLKWFSVVVPAPATPSNTFDGYRKDAAVIQGKTNDNVNTLNYSSMSKILRIWWTNRGLTNQGRAGVIETPDTWYERFGENDHISGSSGDSNGVALYPDGSPRFRFVTMPGGYDMPFANRVSTTNAITWLRQFVAEGGGFTGNCAGSAYPLRGYYWAPSTVDPGVGFSDPQFSNYLGLFPHFGLNLTFNEDLKVVIPSDVTNPFFSSLGRVWTNAAYRGGISLYFDRAHGQDPNTEYVGIYTNGSTVENGVGLSGKAASWIYHPPKNPRSGKLVLNGWHPEIDNNGVGDTNFAFMFAAFDYLHWRANQIAPRMKLALTNGEIRVMSNAEERVGDRQYHFYPVQIPAGATGFTATLSGLSEDVDLYLAPGVYATRRDATASNVATGVGTGSRTVTIASPAATNWMIGVRGDYNLTTSNGAAYVLSVYWSLPNTNTNGMPVATVSPASLATNAAFTATVGLDVGAGFWSTNGGSSWTSFAPPSTTVTIAGARTLLVYGTNGTTVGATNSAVYGWDVSAPSATVNPGKHTNNQAVMVTNSVNEGWLVWSTNNWVTTGTNAAGSNHVVSVFAPDASVTFRYFAFDQAGNVSASNSRTYTFDLRAPVVTVSRSNLTTNAAFTVTLGVDEDSGWWSTNGGLSWATIPSNATTNLTISETTTLLAFGRDVLLGAGTTMSNTSATNSFTYTFQVAGAPVVGVLPAARVTNQAFTATLSLDAGAGFWSTNGGSAWVSFGTAGTNLIVSSAVTLLSYGTNGAVSSLTNAVTYDWDVTPPVPVVPAPFTNAGATNLSLSVNEGVLWFSTNGWTSSNSVAAGSTNLISWTSGDLLLAFRAVDALGNATSFLTNAYSIPFTFPAVTISPSSRSTNASFTASVSLNAGSGRLSLDGGSTWSDFPAPGTNVAISSTVTLLAFGTNGAAVSSTNATSYVWDVTAPVLTVNPGRQTNNVPISFTYSANEGWMVVSTNNFTNAITNASGTNCFLPVFSPSNSVVVSAKAFDAAGNVSSSTTRTYTFDLQAPLVTVSTQGGTNDVSLGTTLSVDENDGWWSTNGGASWGQILTNAPVSLTFTETRTLLVFGRDRTGTSNVSTTNSHLFWISNTAFPVVSANPSSRVTNAAFTATLAVSAGTGFWSTNAGAAWQSFSAPSTTVSIPASRGLLLYGTNAAFVSATNVYDWTVDTIAPLVTATVTNGHSNFGALALGFGVNEGSGRLATNATGPWSSFGIGGTNLTITRSSRFWLWASDAAGNVSATNVYDYAVEMPIDLEAPLWNLVAPADGHRTNAAITVRMAVSESNGYWSTNAGSNWNAVGPGSTLLTISRSVEFLFFARDAVGNGTATNRRVWTIDSVAPTVTGLVESFVTNAPFTLSLGVDKPTGFLSTNNGVTVVAFSNALDLAVKSDVSVWVWTLDAFGNAGPTNFARYRIRPDVSVDGENALSGFRRGEVIRSGGVRLGFRATAKPELVIHDLRGREIRRLKEGDGIDLSGKTGSWDGVDSFGRRCAAGVYVVTMIVDGKAVDQRHLVWASN